MEKLKTINSFALLFFILFSSGCLKTSSWLKQGAEVNPPEVPYSSDFSKADINNDNFIDRKEAEVFHEEANAKSYPSAHWVILFIFILCILCCTLTPNNLTYLKDKALGLIRFLTSKIKPTNSKKS